MGAGDTVFSDYKTNIAPMPSLAKSTKQAIEKAELHLLEISAHFHQFFTYLHASPDGNGRTGGLYVIIIGNDKTNYIDVRKQAAKHHDPSIFTTFFTSVSIDRMQSELTKRRT